MWIEGNGQGSTRMTNSPRFHASCGNSLPPRQWKTPTSAAQCGQGWDPLNKHSSAHSKGRWLGFHAIAPRPLQLRGWIRIVSTSSSCAACGVASPFRPHADGVARPTDSRGHHRAPCATSCLLGCRGYPLESCAARICREAGARVSTNIRDQDLDLLPGGRLDDRRLWVVADGLPLFHGAQLAIDVTLVSPVEPMEPHGDSLDLARPTKERRYPELSAEHGRARFVVLACETGGRWSEEARDFLRHLVRARAKSEPREIRAVARRSWFRRWCTAWSCCAAQAFATSLMERRGRLGLMAQCQRPPVWSGTTRSPREHASLTHAMSEHRLSFPSFSTKKKNVRPSSPSIAQNNLDWKSKTPLDPSSSFVPHPSWYAHTSVARIVQL